MRASTLMCLVCVLVSTVSASKRNHIPNTYTNITTLIPHTNQTHTTQTHTTTPVSANPIPQQPPPQQQQRQSTFALGQSLIQQKASQVTTNGLQNNLAVDNDQQAQKLKHDISPACDTIGVREDDVIGKGLDSVFNPHAILMKYFGQNPWISGMGIESGFPIFGRNGFEPPSLPDHTPLTPEEVAFLHWIEEEGVESPCATIAHFYHPQFVNRTLRGLVANCTIQANKPLLRIPTKLIVTPHRLSNSPMYSEIYELLKLDTSISFDLDHLMLTLFVSLDTQDTNSYWAPYLRLLPTAVNVPAETDDYGMLWYDASTIVQSTKNRLKAISYQFDHLSAFFAEHPQLLPKFHHFNLAKFNWAYNIVTSRSFRLDFGVHRDALCLVPFADMMNHGFTNVGWLFQGKQSLGFYSAHQIDPGQQIFNNYGALGNEWLIQDFGFVLQDNPYTCAHITLPEPSLQDPIRDKRLALLKTQDIDGNTPVCLRLGPPTLELMFAAFALSASGEMLANNLTPENLLQHITENSLQKMVAVLLPALEQRLTQYHYSIQQDERLLPLIHASANQNLGDKLSPRRFDAVFLRLEEKLIIESNILFLNLTAGYKCTTTVPPSVEGSDDRVANTRIAHTCMNYAKRVMIPLLKEIAWESSRKYVKPRPRDKGPYENWDFGQDSSVDLNEGMPNNPCNSGENAAACA